MQQEDGRAGALVEVVHAQAVLLDVVRREAVAGQVLEALVGRAVGVHRPTLRPVGVRIGASGDEPTRCPRRRHPATRPRTRPSSSRRRRDDRRGASGRVRPEGEVVVEQTETERPPRRMPLIWPWLLALLLLVLGGLGAYYYFTQDDDEPPRRPRPTPAATTTAARAAASVRCRTSSARPRPRRPTTLRDGGLEVNLVAVPVGPARPAPSSRRAPRPASEAPEGRRAAERRAGRRPADDGDDGDRRRPLRPATTAPPRRPRRRPRRLRPSRRRSRTSSARSSPTRRATFGDEGLKVAVQYVPSTEPQGAWSRRRSRPGRSGSAATPCSSTSRSVPSRPAATRCRTSSASGRTQARRALEDAGFEVLALNLRRRGAQREPDRVADARRRRERPARLARAPLRRRGSYFGAGSSL